MSKFANSVRYHANTVVMTIMASDLASTSTFVWLNAHQRRRKVDDKLIDFKHRRGEGEIGAYQVLRSPLSTSFWTVDAHPQVFDNRNVLTFYYGFRQFTHIFVDNLMYPWKIWSSSR